MSTRPRSRFQLCPREGARSPAWGGRRAPRTRPPPLALGPSLPRPRAALGPAGRALRTPPCSSPVCHCHSHPAPPLLLRGAPHMAPPFYPVSRGAQRGPWARGSGGPSTSGRSGQADAADAPGARGPPARRGSAGTPPGGPAATSASRGPGRRRRSGRETDAAARRLSAPGASGPRLPPHAPPATGHQAASGREQLVPPKGEEEKSRNRYLAVETARVVVLLWADDQGFCVLIDALGGERGADRRGWRTAEPPPQGRVRSDTAQSRTRRAGAGSQPPSQGTDDHCHLQAVTGGRPSSLAAGPWAARERARFLFAQEPGGGASRQGEDPGRLPGWGPRVLSTAPA